MFLETSDVNGRPRRITLGAALCHQREIDSGGETGTGDHTEIVSLRLEFRIEDHTRD